MSSYCVIVTSKAGVAASATCAACNLHLVALNDVPMVAEAPKVVMGGWLAQRLGGATVLCWVLRLPAFVECTSVS